MDRPNVIWIVTDQLRAVALSCNGDPNVNTPNIDMLAAVGGFPLCCPFRGSMLTGMYPHKCVVGHEYPLPAGQKTLAHVFNDAGYDTAYFGKWHLDGFHEREGRATMHHIDKERRGGFHTWIGYENNNSQWDTWVHGHRGDANIDLYRLPGYETDVLTDMLIEHIDERAEAGALERSKPFFAVLSVQPPHDPYIAPPEYMARHNPATITMRPNVPAIPGIIETARRDLAGAYGMIENIDANVGRVISALRRAGIDKETHIIFFSDHGDMHGSHGMFRKTNPYEESIRIPFIVSGESPMRYDNHGAGNVPGMMNHVDIAPTTLGLCGIAKPAWMQGCDMSHYRLRENAASPDEPDSAFIQSVTATGHGHSIDKPWRGVITRDGWKYVCFEGLSWLLFDLTIDPYEQMNIAHNKAYEKRRKELLARLERWIRETGDSFTLPKE